MLKLETGMSNERGFAAVEHVGCHVGWVEAGKPKPNKEGFVGLRPRASTQPTCQPTEPSLPRYIARIRGFTLVEILVVLLIIGITIGFAMLAFGDFGARRRVVFAAEQFVNEVKLVQHQAALDMGTYGILVNQDSYRVFRFNGSSGWQVMTNNRIFRQHFFPDAVSLRFQPKLGSQSTPQIIINESGDTTPFHLLIELKGRLVAEVVGHHSGLIKLITKSSS